MQSEPHRAGVQWKFAGSFYFAITVITTIGEWLRFGEDLWGRDKSLLPPLSRLGRKGEGQGGCGVQSVKCRMSVLAALPCYVICGSPWATCWTRRCPASLSPGDGTCCPLGGTGEERGYAGGGLVATKWLPPSCGLGGEEEVGKGRDGTARGVPRGRSEALLPRFSWEPCVHLHFGDTGKTWAKGSWMRTKRGGRVNRLSLEPPLCSRG